MSHHSYGGQAVIEGVMMRGKKNMAVAVRRAPEEIVLDFQEVNSIADRFPFLKLPLIRGIVILIESMIMGIKTLTYSANQVVEGDGNGESISPLEMALSVIFAMGAGTVLFFLLPVAFAHLLKPYVTGYILQNLLEGVFRVTILLAYIIIISLMKDIQRVFEYHGAEHKSIYTYEAKEELTVENARKHSTLHPRCGTSFLLFVVVISIIVFCFVGETDIWMRLISRVVLLPVVAGLSYEFLKMTGKYQHVYIMRMFSRPGMWLQKLTTREPDDSQLEVALCALKRVIEAEEGCEKNVREVEATGRAI
ncbi:MAG: DUF1385 domain-containing protein [Clostridia bacterium]|nr:DUF1385 domain-containing protein [Clostridia bacterium]MDD4048138.1 DUF1385 domain-containing protein [Clostridia bacterium]